MSVLSEGGLDEFAVLADLFPEVTPSVTLAQRHLGTATVLHPRLSLEANTQLTRFRTPTLTLRHRSLAVSASVVDMGSLTCWRCR